MDGLVTLDSFESAMSSQEYDDVRDLVKALAAGADINNPGASAGGGFPLRVESLDSTLKVVTHSQNDLVFWKGVPKKPAYNTVEEFNRLDDVGNESGIFIGEGDLPEEDDSTYSRNYTLIKFMGTVRRVTHPMLVIKNAIPDDILSAEARAGTLKLLRGVELGLWDGDATCSQVEFDGFFRKFIDGISGIPVGSSNAAGSLNWYGNINTAATTNLLMDLRNDAITEDHASEIVTRVSDDPNHGMVTDAFLPFRTHLDFSRQFYPKERGNLSHTGDAGTVITAWNSPFGRVKLNPSKFVRMSAPANQVGIGSANKRPNPPTLVAATSPAMGAYSPGFGGATQGRTAPAAVDGAGNYFYQVVAGNRYGESAPLSIGPLAVAVGDRVDLQITDGSPAGVTSYYKIYRSYPGAAAATEAAYIMRVARTAATQTIIDANRFLPYTGRIYWVQRNLEAMAWKQLLPLLKVNLAQIDMTVRFALVLYGALELFAPRKHGIMVNVGRAA